MRAALPVTLLLAACASRAPAVDTASGNGAPGDAGSPPDSGAVADAGVPPDAGPPPAKIDSVPCPGNPKVLWSRTFADEVDFRGAADADGNLYWIEYDPPPTFTDQSAPAWLASSDADGRDRYRVRTPLTWYIDAFALAGGKVIVSKGAVVAAYDAATGAPAWSLDLTGTFTDGYAKAQGAADLGNGELALAMYDYNVASGLYLIDEETGAIVWSAVGGKADAYMVEGSDGAGHALATADYGGSLFAIDGSGHELWRHSIAHGAALLAWSSGAPWISLAASEALVPSGDYVAAPSSWFAAVQAPDLAFALEYGPAAVAPNRVNVIRNGAVIAAGDLTGTNPYDGTAAFPFLAGESGDHLILVTQRWPGSPGLCHPATAANAALSRFAAASSYQCPFTFQGESGIEGVALLHDRIVLGRRTYLTDGCTHDVQPVTIEAYGLPGESLAPHGWVQRGGNPGLGMRPIR